MIIYSLCYDIMTHTSLDCDVRSVEECMIYSLCYVIMTRTSLDRDVRSLEECIIYLLCYAIMTRTSLDCDARSVVGVLETGVYDMLTMLHSSAYNNPRITIK